MISLGPTGAASRPTVRKHRLVCASISGRGQLNRPARQSQGGPNRGTSTGSGNSTVSRNELVLYLQRLQGDAAGGGDGKGLQPYMYAVSNSVGTPLTPATLAPLATATACMLLFAALVSLLTLWNACEDRRGLLDQLTGMSQLCSVQRSGPFNALPLVSSTL
jgi:hypothetical protein